MKPITWDMVSDTPENPPDAPPAPALHEYAFDIYLTAAVRVRAADEESARRELRDKLDCADTNFGAWVNGDPILAEASLIDDGNCRPPHLYEIDGEDVT